LERAQFSPEQGQELMGSDGFGSRRTAIGSSRE